MIQLTYEQLRAIMPNARPMRASCFLAPINATLVEFGIDTAKRAAAFLAQIAHESGQLVYTKELASGAAYEGRHDLGNTQPGDGVRFKGRGLIQVTGRANMVKLAADLKIDCVNHPELLEEPSGASRSAGWFWRSKNLSQFADSDDFVKLTERINGGHNGLAERQAFWATAKRVLGV